MNWRVWFSSLGMDRPFERRAFEINNYPLLIEAACNGQGVALGWGHLVDEALESGKLVRPLDAEVATELAYYMVWPSRDPRSAEAEAFCAWFAGNYPGSNNLHR